MQRIEGILRKQLPAHSRYNLCQQYKLVDAPHQHRRPSDRSRSSEDTTQQDDCSCKTLGALVETMREADARHPPALIWMNEEAFCYRQQKPTKSVHCTTTSGGAALTFSPQRKPSLGWTAPQGSTKEGKADAPASNKVAPCDDGHDKSFRIHYRVELRESSCEGGCQDQATDGNTAVKTSPGSHEWLLIVSSSRVAAQACLQRICSYPDDPHGYPRFVSIQPTAAFVEPCPWPPRVLRHVRRRRRRQDVLELRGWSFSAAQSRALVQQHHQKQKPTVTQLTVCVFQDGGAALVNELLAVVVPVGVAKSRPTPSLGMQETFFCGLSVAQRTFLLRAMQHERLMLHFRFNGSFSPLMPDLADALARVDVEVLDLVDWRWGVGPTPESGDGPTQLFRTLALDSGPFGLHMRNCFSEEHTQPFAFQRLCGFLLATKRLRDLALWEPTVQPLQQSYLMCCIRENSTLRKLDLNVGLNNQAFIQLVGILKTHPTITDVKVHCFHQPNHRVLRTYSIWSLLLENPRIETVHFCPQCYDDETWRKKVQPQQSLSRARKVMSSLQSNLISPTVLPKVINRLARQPVTPTAVWLLLRHAPKQVHHDIALFEGYEEPNEGYYEHCSDWEDAGTCYDGLSRKSKRQTLETSFCNVCDV